MRSIVCRLGVALLAVSGMAALPVAACAGDAIARVAGGGRADFVPHPKALNSTGFTNFSVGVSVYDDGTASGHFVCVIPSVVIISLAVTEGTVNGDGSVTVSGLGHGFDSFIPGPFKDLPVTVTFREGGPGVGGFDYTDESGFFEPDLFDTELITHGKIKITP